MRTKRRTQVIALICAAIVSAATAVAASAQPTSQTTPAATTPALQLTPFIAMGDDLAPGAGAAFTFNWARSLSVEAEASLGTDAARSSLSLLYGLPRWGRFSTYLAGGAGVQRDEVAGSNMFLRTKKTEFAVNIGAGVTVPIADRFQYRADFRWYNPDDAWPESWRVYSGVTFGLRR